MQQPATTFVVTFSGGKDSVATWLHLERERGVRVQCVFADTGWESEKTYRYLDYLVEKCGCPLMRVHPKVRHLWVEGTAKNLTPSIIKKLEACFADFRHDANDLSVLDWQIDMRKLVMLKGRPPSATARFCTTTLKLRPLRDYVVAHWQQMRQRVVIATGIRAEESEKRAGVPRKLIDDLTGRPRWNPIQQWPVADVFAIHKSFGVLVNPHYLMGCSRFGCWPCIHSNKPELAVFAKDAEGVGSLKILESDLGQTFFAANKVSARYRSDIDPKTGKRINWADDVLRWALG